MKASKIFIISAFVSVLCLGVAYASYWEQDIVATTTVDTGELSIQVLSEQIQEVDYIDTEIELENNVSEGYLGINKNDLLVNIKGMYPGSYVDYQFDVENTGTLGIFLENITVQCQPQDESKCDEGIIIVNDLECHYKGKGNHDCGEPNNYNCCDYCGQDIPIICSCDHIELNNEIEIEYAYDGSSFMPLNMFLGKIQRDEISNDDSRTYHIRMWFDRDKSLKENELEETEAVYIFSINYKQFNEMNVPKSSDD